MATSYPTGFDTFPPSAEDATSAIEQELGLNPSGSYATVAARFTADETALAPLTSLFRSVDAYGAVGDGVTDDRAAILAAIAATPPGGSTFFADKKYAISGPITIEPGKRLVGLPGAGRRGFTGDTPPTSGSRLAALPSFSGAAMLLAQDKELGGYAVDHESAGIYDITLDGTGKTTGAFAGLLATGYVHGLQLSNFNVSGVRGDGIGVAQYTRADTSVKWPYSWSFRNVHIWNIANGVGINITKPLTDTVMENVRVIGMASGTNHGIVLTSMANSTFTNVRCEWANGRGIVITGNWGDGTFPGSGGATFINISTDSNGNDGVYVDATGSGALQFQNLMLRRDGRGTGSPAAGLPGAAGMNIAAATCPILIDGIATLPAEDDGGAGATRPDKGLKISGAVKYVSVSNAVLHAKIRGLDWDNVGKVHLGRNVLQRAGGTGTYVETQPHPSRTSGPAAVACQGVNAVLRRKNRTATIQLIGDSTGDADNEWFGLLATRLAAANPAYTVWMRHWSDANQAYALSPTVMQTGTGGARKLTLTGGTSYLRLPCNTLMPAITGDIDVVARLNPSTWGPATAMVIAGQYDAGTNQRNWAFLLAGTKKPQYVYSTTGGAGPTIVTSANALPFVDGNEGWVRVQQQNNNGAGKTAITFSYSSDGVTWTTLATDTTGASITGRYASTASHTVGAQNHESTPANFLTGDIYEVNVRSGLDLAAAHVLPMTLDNWEIRGNLANATFSGAPILHLINSSVSGQNMSYFDATAARRAKVYAPLGQQVIMTSTSHNEPANFGWSTHIQGVWAPAIANIKSLQPGVPILTFGQPPSVTGSFKADQTTVDVDVHFSAMLGTWAASQAGVYYADLYPGYDPASMTIAGDGVHPITGEYDGGTGRITGSAAMADAVMALMV